MTGSAATMGRKKAPSTPASRLATATTTVVATRTAQAGNRGVSTRTTNGAQARPGGRGGRHRRRRPARSSSRRGQPERQPGGALSSVRNRSIPRQPTGAPRSGHPSTVGPLLRPRVEGRLGPAKTWQFGSGRDAETPPATPGQDRCRELLKRCPEAPPPSRCRSRDSNPDARDLPRSIVPRRPRCLIGSVVRYKAERDDQQGGAKHTVGAACRTARLLRGRARLRGGDGHGLGRDRRVPDQPLRPGDHRRQ